MGSNITEWCQRYAITFYANVRDGNLYNKVDDYNENEHDQEQ